MRDIYTELKRLRKQFQLAQQELQELQDEKKPALPDGWEILQGGRKD